MISASATSTSRKAVRSRQARMAFRWTNSYAVWRDSPLSASFRSTRWE